MDRGQRLDARTEPMEERRPCGDQRLRARKPPSPWSAVEGRSALGTGARVRSRCRIGNRRDFRGLLREAAGGPVAGSVRDPGQHARHGDDSGRAFVGPQRLILAHSCFELSRGTIVAEELETAQIPPHIMAAMRERMKMAQRMSRIKHKIVVMSGKGGVGKSSVAANLACVLAENASVGLVDADVTGPDIPMLMGVQDAQVKATETVMEPTVGPAGVKVISMAQLIDRDTAVVLRGPLKIKALKQMLSDVEWGDLDYLVIDLPPGTSDEPLSVGQEIPDADRAVVVTTPQQ